MRRMLNLLLALFLSFSCIATKQKQKNKSTTNQLDLQEDIQRFYTRFTERIIEAGFKDQSLISQFKSDTIRQYLLYDSEALKIATAPFPAVNLLDMLVFIKLNRIVIRDFWIPEVYGKLGEPLLAAFVESDKDLEQVASKALTAPQLEKLNLYINRWRKENPEQIRVEKIRLADFSKFAKAGEKKEKSYFLVDTASAVEAVDQMVLVANRGIFLAQQLPLIIRLHARLGTQEVISDSLSHLQSAPKLLHEINETSSLVGNLNNLTKEIDRLMLDSRSVIKLMPQTFKGGIDVGDSIKQLNSMLDKTSLLIEQLRSTRPVNKNVTHEIQEAFKRLIWFFAGVMALVACLTSIFWWCGHYLSNKYLAKHRST